MKDVLFKMMIISRENINKFKKKEKKVLYQK